jgi:anti-sigma regulatory factor (Ser/Thr protein kinase)
MDDTTTEDRAFEALTSAIGAARSYAVARAEAHGELASTVALVTSELASNAVLHARTPFLVRVEHTAAGIRVGVYDGSPLLPDRRPHRPEEATGRGLAIVESLSEAWGIDVTPEGKWVWAVVPADGSEHDGAAGER